MITGQLESGHYNSNYEAIMENINNAAKYILHREGRRRNKAPYGSQNTTLFINICKVMLHNR